jgi:hypothetical protein
VTVRISDDAVAIACGESLSGDSVGSTWGWEFTWTLRDGDQVLEQHKYMECRFVRLTFSAPAPNFALNGWRASYPWYEEDSMFSSSNATLDEALGLAKRVINNQPEDGGISPAPRELGVEYCVLYDEEEEVN